MIIIIQNIGQNGDKFESRQVDGTKDNTDYKVKVLRSQSDMTKQGVERTEFASRNKETKQNYFYSRMVYTEQVNLKTFAFS